MQIKCTTKHDTFRRCGLLIALFAVALTLHAQHFVNLSAHDIRIDSVLPVYTHAFPLQGQYSDTVYTASVKYPEYIDMTLEEVARYQRITPHPDIVEQRIVVERKKASLEVIVTPIVVVDGKYKWLVSFMIDISRQPVVGNVSTRQQSAAASAPSSSIYAPNSVLREGTWAKIRVSETGVYQITPELIKAAGFSNINNIKVYGYGGALQPEAIMPDYLAQTDDLKEVPLYRNGTQLLFHAQGPVSYQNGTIDDILTNYGYKTTQNITQARRRNYYSDYGYYFLTEASEPHQTVDSATFVSGFYPSPHYCNSLYETEAFAWYQGGRQLYDSETIGSGNTAEYKLQRKGTGETGRVIFYATADVETDIDVSLNGEKLGTFPVRNTDSYDHGCRTGKVWQVNNLEADNTFTITNNGRGTVRIDYIQITVPELNMAQAPRLSAQIAHPVPEYVHHITNQNLHADSPIDMLIIIPTSQKLLAQAERLKQHHEQHDGIRVRIVPADELYNEFSSGTPDANAYRRYLKMLYDRAETEADMPRWLLLFGDAAWDNRMNSIEWNAHSTNDFLLAMESENSLNEILCYVDDGFYGLLDDGEGANPMSKDKLDIGIGRFPVRTDAQAKVLVDKTINYAKNANAGAWQNTLMFMGDDGNGNEHMKDANDAAEDIKARYPGYVIKKVMWDAYKRETSATGNTYPEASKVIKQQQEQGALVMDYAGHGSEVYISHERVLTINDFQQFTNKNLPLWISASCDVMPFDAANTNIGEEAILNPNGGAIAFFGTTRTVYASRNRVMNMAYLRHVLSIKNDRRTTLGEAQQRAKNDLIASGQDLTTNKLQYSLLGDPALPLNTPRLQVVIDTINNMPARGASATEPINLKAGQYVVMKGHILEYDTTATHFNGTVHATVRDAREQIVCKRNDPDMDKVIPPVPAFIYYDHTKTLYAGADNVNNGKFSITFAVPMDINYSDNNGLINLHAVNKNNMTQLAHGSYDNIVVGGSDISGNDSIGPSIYCYLNSPSFTNGDKVNTTPFFVANITDKDGINAAGTGIGHDMELCIDGQMEYTFNLNNNFQFDFGSYTSGTTFYSIPELTPGRHSLTFRVWDILNNPSTATLDFQVVKALKPILFSVDCTNNPAYTHTTFIITHDRTGSPIDIELDVFDLSGRLLWKHKENGVSTASAYTVDWDLTIGGGQKLQTGVYVYRVMISNEGSKQASKAKKLIVVNK